MRYAIIVSALAIAGCREALPPEGPFDEIPSTRAPAYNTTDRDGIGTPIGDGCRQLRKIGCPEGFETKRRRTCFEHFTVLTALADVPADCFKRSTSPEDARACGDARTHRVRCFMPPADQP